MNPGCMPTPDQSDLPVRYRSKSPVEINGSEQAFSSQPSLTAHGMLVSDATIQAVYNLHTIKQRILAIIIYGFLNTGVTRTEFSWSLFLKTTSIQQYRCGD